MALLAGVGLALASFGSTGISTTHGAQLHPQLQVNGPGCSTPASQNVGGFAIDGNLQRQCSDTRDWATGPGGSGVVQATRNADGSCTNAAITALVLCDGVKNGDLSIFDGGNKESDPCSWVIHSSPPPPPLKDDITNAYISGTQALSGTVYVYGGLEFVGRTNNPSTNYDMELNQSAPDGIPNRKPGDVLLSVDFNGPNSPFTVKVWVAKTPAQDANVVPCGTQTANYDFANPDYTATGDGALALGPNITAAINTSTIDCGSWQCYDNKYNLTNTLPAYNFTEAGFNLSNILAGTGVDPCATVMVSYRSRASGSSVMAQLKDAVGPQAFKPCRSSVTAAHVSRFTATRHGNSVMFQWRAGVQADVVGFALYSGNQRLNSHLIARHSSPNYRFTVHGNPSNRFSLHTLMRDGRQLVVSAGHQ